MIKHRDTQKSRPPVSGFDWSGEEKAFSWIKTGRVNIVHEAIDRRALDPEQAGRTALVFDSGDAVQRFSFSDLKQHSCRWANVLKDTGIGRGDRVFVFLRPSPGYFFAMLACARLGVLFCPVNSSLGARELKLRIDDACPVGIITDSTLSAKIPLPLNSPVKHLFIASGPLPEMLSSEISMEDSTAHASCEREPEWLDLISPLYMVYVSGGTGPPRGVLHSHGDMVGHRMTARRVLGLDEGSVIWTDGDPAWVTSIVYSVFAPWLCGSSTLAQAAPFSAGRWYRTLRDQRVSVWYTTPMNLQRLMEAENEPAGGFEFPNLRLIATVGAGTGAELTGWVRSTFAMTPKDTWWMRETGIICIATDEQTQNGPGSMGKPVPGIQAAVLSRERQILPDGCEGELALLPPWPGFMTGIWNDESRYLDYFSADGWFLTGDIVTRDHQGNYYHLSRNDDQIRVRERVIGPFEIEHALLRHPEVMEAAAITWRKTGLAPFIRVFVALKEGADPSAHLKQEIKEFLMGCFDPAPPVEEIVFLDRLPKTVSGKLMRGALREDVLK